MLGPFWRDDQPLRANGDTLVRSPTPGTGLLVHACLEDGDGHPIAGAEIDVWHSSPEGFYENQDPNQAEMNLRGRFVSDDAGRFHFRSVKPAGYPIPVDGPVGELVRATRRHNFRPAHLHFMVYKPGFKTLISQVYSPDDEHIDSDVQFGVTRALIGNYVRHGIRSISASRLSPGSRGVRWHPSAPRRRPLEPDVEPDRQTRDRSTRASRQE
jgi:catechol 1,2-dioxygenase